MTQVLTTFPEQDKCPMVCQEIGAFKKAAKSPEKALEEVAERREEQEAAADAVAENAAMSPSMPDPSTLAGIDPGGKDPKDYEYLPGLKPGPDGKVDWTPLAGMTGTRPPVSKYSLSRYSLDEWRAHNESVLDPKIITESYIVEYNAKTAIMRAFGR